MFGDRLFAARRLEQFVVVDSCNVANDTWTQNQSDSETNE